MSKAQILAILAVLAWLAWWYRCELFGIQCGVVTVEEIEGGGWLDS